MDTEKDYFAILGVLPSIDDVALAAVYRALLKKYHPDVFKGSKADAERRTREIIEAYEVLGNPENRKAYDNVRSYRHEAQTTSYSDEATADWKVVNNETFYQKLIQVLLQSGFRLRATELYKDVSKDRGELGSVIRTGIRKVIAAVPPDFDQDGVQQHINKVREWAAVACLKYSLSAPYIAAIVEADQLAHEEIIKLANRFDKILWKIPTGYAVSNAKFPAVGIMLLVFFDHRLASTFIERTQERCKIRTGRTWVLPWVIDVSNKTVSSHHPWYLPLLTPVLSQTHLQREIFQ